LTALRESDLHRIERPNRLVMLRDRARLSSAVIGSSKYATLIEARPLFYELLAHGLAFPADRAHCVNESTMGGESSYTDLLTCLVMARDVGTMREQQAKANPPAAAKLPKQHRRGHHRHQRRYRPPRDCSVASSSAAVVV
jgi:hypothetical protein